MNAPRVWRILRGLVRQRAGSEIPSLKSIKQELECICRRSIVRADFNRRRRLMAVRVAGKQPECIDPGPAAKTVSAPEL